MILICRVCFHLLRVVPRVVLPRDEVLHCAFCGHELEELHEGQP